MRLHALALLSAGFVLAGLPSGVQAEDTPRLPDMRQLISSVVRQRWPAPVAAMPKPRAPEILNVDPDLVTLPPILVHAPAVRTPAKEDMVRQVVGAIRPVSYTEYVTRDTKRQREMRDLLDLADLTQSEGDPALARKVRRETYRALTRDPTPLERAMDRSANGGRY